MKKLFLFLIVISTISFGQMLEAKDVVAELDLGFPNFKPFTDDPSGIDHISIFNLGSSKVNSYGQFIARGEYFASDQIGLAAAFSYSYFHTFDEAIIDKYDGVTGLWTTQKYFYETKVNKIRFTAGLNFHLIRTDRLDTYFGVQGGTKKAFGSYHTNDPDAQGSLQAYVIPIAIRIHYGVRFFFNEFLAANFEIGLGGPLVSFGATYKF